MNKKQEIKMNKKQEIKTRNKNIFFSNKITI